MPEVEANDPLSRNTARLSISISNLEEEENPRHQVAEFLKASNGSRRDSAVSITSVNEETDVDTSLSGFKDKYEGLKQSLSDRPKRRRSSASSVTSNNNKNSLLKPETKIHKKKLKKSQEPPSFELVTSASADKKHPSIKKLSLTNIRDLIIHIFSKDLNHNLSWIRLKQVTEIKKIVFCFVPGLVTDEFLEPNSPYADDKFIPMSQTLKIEELEFFKENFDSMIQVTAPGSKDSLFLALHTLTNVPLTKKEKKDQIDSLRKAKLTLWDLLLSKESMSQNNYPIHSSLIDDGESINVDSNGWVQTKSFDHEGSHTFALDCEFCQSASGKVLTRISLINFQGEIVLDLLVKPEEIITDYLTKYSGITEAKLAGITTNLNDIQEKIISIVSTDDILIGHSLESDLNVMHIKHPRIIDTALVYEHHRGPPLKPSLKWLSEKYLNRLIQEGENVGDGHSSVEDAKACLDLIKVKLQEGEYFGKNMNEISLFERINKDRLSIKSSSSHDPIKSLFIDYTPVRDTNSKDSQNQLQKIQISNDDEAIDHLSDKIDDTDLTLLKLRELEFNKGWSPIPKTYDGYLGISEEKSESDDVLDEDKSYIFRKLNERLKRIYSSLPENAMLIVCSLLGDPREMIRLQNVRKKFQSLEREGIDVTSIPEQDSWNFEKQCELQQAVNLSRRAMCFICLKQANKKN